MNLTELKAAWHEYDDKLKAVNTISDKIILSMIRERSSSRLSTIENVYRFTFVSNTIWILLILASIASNPFDFTHPVQYIPMTVVGISLVIFLGISLRSYRDLKKVDIRNSPLAESLKQIIVIFEKPWKYIKQNIILMMVAASLFPLSFLPRAIEAAGLWSALLYELTPIVVVALVMYFISIKTGLFKERYAATFRNDLQDLEELKSMSSELMN